MTRNRCFTIGSAILLSLVQVVGVSEVVRSESQGDRASAKSPEYLIFCDSYASVSTSLKAIPANQILPIIQLLRNAGASAQRCDPLDKLGEIGPAAVSYLIPLLSDRDPIVRANGADALRKLGDFEKAAVPQLILMLKDSNSIVRSSVVSALKRIFEYREPEKIVPYLIPLLKDSDSTVRYLAFNAMRSIGELQKMLFQI
jgi:HEAT repeats